MFFSNKVNLNIYIIFFNDFYFVPSYRKYKKEGIFEVIKFRHNKKTLAVFLLCITSPS